MKQRMHVVVINGHPRPGSFSEALVNAFVSGAKASNVSITPVHLYALHFNPHVIVPSPRNQFMEEDIVPAQQLIARADHLVFIYPTWWGTMPALLKGFIDRVFTPGFAFEDIEGGTGYHPLLRGRSAQIITTMDTPKFVYHLIYRSPGHNALKRATLQFCGISPVKTLIIQPLKNSTLHERKRWLTKVEQMGASVASNAVTLIDKFWIEAGNWLKAIRLQFYPMSWVAYACGAFAAEHLGYGYDRGIFWLGYTWIFLLEVATVLSNDYYDYTTDRNNKYFGPFSGGSRVLVDQLLSFKAIKNGIAVVLALSFVAILLLSINLQGSVMQPMVICGTLFILALGYTVPPLRLSYRTLGEINVGVTHSLAVIFCGYVFQGGNAMDAFPWLLALPLFLAVLPSIILAGIPDYEADKAAMKKTIAVRFGKKAAVVIAISFTIIAAIVVVFFKMLNVLSCAYGNAIYFVVPHAILLCYLLSKHLQKSAPTKRIDTLLIVALTYLIWFGLVPLLSL